MSELAVTTSPINLKRFRSPGTVIARFVSRRTIRGAISWALVFSIYVAAKGIGFVSAYPTEAARQKIAATFSNNVGIELILGKAPPNASTAAYVAWNTLGIMVIIGSIWAFLLTTKYLRGEEDSGRWEILLGGQTTARRAALNTLGGVGLNLLAFFIVLSLGLAAVGKSHGIDYGTSSSLFLALSVVAGIELFVMVGALASQIMPTRGRAAGVSGMVLGVSFAIKAIGDVTGAQWLLNLTPLGWVEKLKPLSGSNSVWFIPIILSIVVLGGITVYFAGKRDLGESIVADKSTAKPKYKLLNSPLGLALRLTRASSIGWLTGISAVSLLFGLMTKSATQAFSQSTGGQHILTKLSHQSQEVSALTFLGLVFFLQMTFVMFYAANSISAIRREEAENYLDSLLVRPYSRMKWLWGRIVLTSGVLILAGLLTCVGMWIGTTSQGAGVSFGSIFQDSVNMLVPVVVVMGFGLFAFGFRPRLTSLVAYAVIGWSFLIEMVSSGININHWILDTSVLHHIVLAPASKPDWFTDLILVGIALVLCLLGTIAFDVRDLATE